MLGQIEAKGVALGVFTSLLLLALVPRWLAYLGLACTAIVMQQKPLLRKKLRDDIIIFAVSVWALWRKLTGKKPVAASSDVPVVGGNSKQAPSPVGGATSPETTEDGFVEVPSSVVAPKKRVITGERAFDKQMINKSGYLMKKERNFPFRWQKRFIDCAGLQMRYYETEDKSLPKGDFKLNDAQLKDHKEKPNAFKIALPDKTMEFQAASRTDKEEWLRVLDNNIQVHQMSAWRKHVVKNS